MEHSFSQKPANFLHRHKGSVTVIVLNSVLTAAMFWWSQADFRYFGQNYLINSADSYLNGWVLYQTLENLLSRPLELGYSEMFYPDPNSLAYTIASYGAAIQMLPFYVFCRNIFLTNNLYTFLTYPLTAWVSFLFVRYLFRTRWYVAALVGCMVTFAPFRVLHLSHYETSSTHLLIFVLYCLHRLIHEMKTVWALGFAVAFFLTLQTSGYLGVFAAIITLLILGFYLLGNYRKMSKKLLFNLLLAFTLTSLLNAPFVIYKLGNPGFSRGADVGAIIGRSALVNDWIVGSSWLGAMLATKYGKPLWIGFVPLTLSIVAILNWKYFHGMDKKLDEEGRQSFSHRDVILLYGIITVLGYLFTLGPRIEVAGTNISFDSPYRLLTSFFGFSQLRAPRRFIFLPIIGTAVLSAYSLKLLSFRMKRHRYALLLIAIAVGLFLEYLPQPDKKEFVSGPFPAPGPVYGWLADLPAETPIVHIPPRKGVMVQVLQYQSIHRQPTINGVGSFLPEWYPGNWYSKGDPVDMLNSDSLALMQEHGVRYILVHRSMMSVEEILAFEEAIIRLEKDWGELPFVNDFDQVEVYSLPSALR